MSEPGSEPAPDVVVVGAGLAGLAAARDLARAGRTVVVVEARDRVGGRIVNHRFDDGTTVEIGGQWVGPTQDRILALARDVDVPTFPTYDTGELITARDGKIIRHRSPTFGLPPAAVVEIAASQPQLERLARRVDLDAPWSTRGAERLDGTTFETWIRRHHRTPSARGFWRLAIEAVFAAEPRDISLLHVAFYLHSGGSLERLLGTRRGAQQDRFVGGSVLVAEKVADELRAQGVALRLGAPVRAIEQGADGVVVRHDGGEVRAGRAIVAVPPALAGRIAWSPVLPPRRDQLLQKMPMGSVIKCLVRYERPFWRDDGLCGQAAAIDDAVTITFDNTPPDEGAPGVLVAFLEGDHARRAADLTPAGRERQVIRSLTRYFGSGAASPTGYAELDWAAEEWTRGCYGAHLAPGVWTSFGDLLRQPWGRIHWAGTETAAVWNGYMDGAVSSGERAATEILARRAGRGLRVTRPRPEKVELSVIDPAPAVEAFGELVEARGGWINLLPEVDEDDAVVVTPSAVGAMFRAPGLPIPQATLIAPTEGRRGRKAGQLGMTHGVGSMVVGRLADEGLAVPDDWKIVQDHLRRGLVLRLDDPPDVDRAVIWALEAGTLLCPIPTTGRWLAEVHRSQ